jgi:hypothetical protein
MEESKILLNEERVRICIYWKLNLMISYLKKNKRESERNNWKIKKKYTNG